MMKLKYIGSKSDPMELINGKVYKCLGVENGWYRVVDESGEDYLYPPEEFEVVEKEQVA
ncbi:MAG: hypothetical protein ACI4A5_09090 [Hominilimicola sp.]